jgi:hypothetical protein
MAKRRERLQEDQTQDDGQNQGRSGDKLQQAQEKLARMEATNKICFRLRSDFAKIEEELKPFKYTQSELDHILEPKGPKNIPGFSYSEIESQRQFVKRISSRSGTAEGHAAAVEESQKQVDEIER